MSSPLASGSRRVYVAPTYDWCIRRCFSRADREVLADQPVVVARPHVQDADVLAAQADRWPWCRTGSSAASPASLRPMRRLKNGLTMRSRAEVRVVLAVVAAGTGARAREVEEGRAVEEEVALLGIEQREAREVDLPLIDLGLREVGVDGQVRAQRRRRVVEEVDAGLAGSPSLSSLRAGASCALPRTYGLMSRPCPWVTLVRPVTRPALVIR